MRHYDHPELLTMLDFDHFAVICRTGEAKAVGDMVGSHLDSIYPLLGNGKDRNEQELKYLDFTIMNILFHNEYAQAREALDQIKKEYGIMDT